MIIDLFYAEGCSKCSSARTELRAKAEELIPDVIWHEINVLDEIDYAVEVGVLNLPAIAIDRKLVFSSLPSLEKFEKALIQHARLEEPDEH
jgi:thioredoxin 1